MKQKILILSNFSSSIDGVYQRAKQEAIEFEKSGFEVRIFSSNAVKGSPNKIAPQFDKIGKNIKIQRFPFIKLGGESFLIWEFKREALEFKPNFIICHSFRHIHCQKGLRVAQMLKIPCFLITHCPFNRKRPIIQEIIVKLYDLFIGRKILNQFDKVIAITKWELPYLKKLGITKDKVIYLPNGVPNEFFKTKTKKGERNSILYLGRVAPIKNLEILIRVCRKLGEEPTIVGPKQAGYNIKAKIQPPVYDIKEKIKLIDKHEIFILPSKMEGHPQCLIEALARGRIVIGRNIEPIRELINRKNGFLFDDEADLFYTLEYISRMMTDKEKSEMSKLAIRTAEKFKISNIMKKWQEIL